MWWSGRITSLAILVVPAVFGLAEGQRGFGQDFEVRLSMKLFYINDEDYLVFSPNSKFLVAASHSWMRVWDLEKDRERMLVDEQGERVDGGVDGVSFSPDEKTLALACSRNGVRLLDISTGKERDSQMRAQLGRGHVSRWYVTAVKEKDVILGKIRDRLYSLVFTPDGTTLVAAYSKVVIVWDLARRRERIRLSDLGLDCTLRAIAPDGKTLASNSSRGVRIWNLDSGKESALLESEAFLTPICLLQFAPDGNTLAAQNAEPEVYIWDVKRKKLTAILKHSNRSSLRRTLAFSSDSRTLAVVDNRGAIHLWEIASGSERAIFHGKQENLGPLAFSPDGRTLAVGCRDDSLKDGKYSIALWDLLSIKRKPPEAKELADLWAALRDEDATIAYRAIRTLTAFPAQTLPLLRRHLLPLFVGAEEARKLVSLIADLDSDDFATRERANKKLEEAGLRAEAALQHTLGRSPSLEARRRMLKLLEGIERRKKLKPIQQLRAVEVLEHIGTTEARALLQDLAKGAPETRLTQEAKASLARLAKRPSPKP